jgi:hypothetical protein
VVRLLGGDLQRLGLVEELLAAGAAATAEEGVGRDPVEPGAERGVGLEAVQPSPGA